MKFILKGGKVEYVGSEDAEDQARQAFDYLMLMEDKNFILAFEPHEGASWIMNWGTGLNLLALYMAVGEKLAEEMECDSLSDFLFLMLVTAVEAEADED